MVATLNRPRLATAQLDVGSPRRVGGPVFRGWQEGTLTRASEIEALAASVWRERCGAGVQTDDAEELRAAIGRHLDAARDAAERRRTYRRPRNAAMIERARSNLDAAEAQLLNLAPPGFVLGQT